MRTFFQRAHKPLRFGHRGAAALAPANSLEAIEAALATGVDGVELDVVSANGRLLLAHSLVELRRASPSLEEALDLLSGRNVLVDLDVKAPGFEEELVAGLRRHGLLDRALVSSFFPGVLRAARAAEPSLPIGLSYPHDRTGAGERVIPARVLRAGLAGLGRVLPYRIAGMLRRAEADTAVLHHLVVSPALVERCRSLGAPVLAWTVNDPAALRRVTRLGVDGVITDDPRIFERS